MVGQVVYVGTLALCVVLMIYQIKRGKLEAVTDILFRWTGGMVGLLCANALLGWAGLEEVGINVWTFFVVGALGGPGAVVLYILVNVL